MKKYFYLGLLGLVLFEFLKVYFIMPMPGSQAMNTVDIAYFLHSYRWVFRVVFVVLIGGGSAKAFRIRKKWLPAVTLLIAAAITFMLNFKLSADKMFLQPETIVLKSQTENKVPSSRLVIGFENNGEATAYPIEFMAYHHQVQDIVGGKHVMVTYCSVCRTGRIYDPVVKGHAETFRLVGMDHFNAMLEDVTTGSWWRQATGEAVTGKMKGQKLAELKSMQMTVDMWFRLYPHGKVMQEDVASIADYDSLARFEQGKSNGSLTRTDLLSWKDKSWVVGICAGDSCKAYDWNELKSKRIINDKLGKTYLFLALAADGKSFAAFERPAEKIFTIKNDTLFSGDEMYDFSGNDLKLSPNKLKSINAYQEFWHSWRTFHPGTLK